MIETIIIGFVVGTIVHCIGGYFEERDVQRWSAKNRYRPLSETDKQEIEQAVAENIKRRLAQ